MWKELLKNAKLASKIQNIVKENVVEILDVVVFGSSVKGKEKPKDLDLLVIYKTKINPELSYKIKKAIEVLGVEIDLVQKSYKDLFDSAFIARESYISEGYSLVQRKYIADGLGYKPMVLFRYDIKSFNKSQRMRFYYSLYGRNSEGMLKKLKLYKFSERIILSPLEESEKVKDYLNSWKMDYLEVPILIPTRILESDIIKER